MAIKKTNLKTKKPSEKMKDKVKTINTNKDSQSTLAKATKEIKKEIKESTVANDSNNKPNDITDLRLATKSTKFLEQYKSNNNLQDTFIINEYANESMSRPIIEVINLVKLYDNFLAVDNLNFTVKRGEIFGILGPNGAGKTTTMEIMETVLHKTAGEIKIDGLDVDRYPFEIKKRIGVQLQSTSFFKELNLIELVNLFADIYNVEIDPIKVLDSISLVDKSNSNIEQLSKGQQQRFSLAISIISNPKIIFLDEPTTGLDPQARRGIWNIIKELKAQGTTIVLTTHYMEEAEVLCDRLAIMDSGKILEINTVKGFVEKLLLKGFKRDIPKYSATLEDVFIELTGKNLRD
jgi:ABC-2 type transport system ATP-binding protein